METETTKAIDSVIFDIQGAIRTLESVFQTLDDVMGDSGREHARALIQELSAEVRQLQIDRASALKRGE